jgi:DNA-binding transcriptional MerR regulator
MNADSVRWTLDELCEQAALALEADAPGLLDGRVREVPDRRTIRYYTTLGLIGRPAEMRGRTAYYTHKHLWQLLAIKRLQARGQSLVQIQQALLGLSEQELRRLAGGSGKPASKRQARAPEREAFWRTAAAAVEPAPPASDPATLQGMRLGPGVVLMLETLREMRDEDREALRLAAAPLVELLRMRGLIGREC